jgi:hypothetical protein
MMILLAQALASIALYVLYLGVLLGICALLGIYGRGTPSDRAVG